MDDKTHAMLTSKVDTAREEQQKTGGQEWAVARHGRTTADFYAEGLGYLTDPSRCEPAKMWAAIGAAGFVGWAVYFKFKAGGWPTAAAMLAAYLVVSGMIKCPPPPPPDEPKGD